MGVTHLWSILAPVKQHTPLSSLQGQTVAVDLSIWVCENQCVKSMQGVVARPYLRNLFFRVSYLTQLGVRLVFVIEGAAPQLKWQEMQRRQQALGRGGGRAGHGSRGHFNARLRECCQLLDLMGIPYIQSCGEAEAMCAALNAAGLVDACITDDGDVFLYGARTVYKNFTMNNKDPHVESYSMSAIEEDLGISRESLVAVALLLGCDYLPGGVPGVGVDRVIKYLDSLKGVDLLRRFYQWSTLSPGQCVSKIEILIRQKALAVPDFPQKKIIAEFMVDQEVVPNTPFVWRRPHIPKTQEYAEAKMEWPPDYTTEKVLPLVTLWDLSHLATNTKTNIRHLKPNRIVKPRVRHGVPVYEVEWWKQVDDTETSHEFYVTMEEQSLFGRVFPHLVQEYEEEKAVKKNKKKGPRKSKKQQQCPEELDDELSSQLRSLDLDCETQTATSSQNTCPPFPSRVDSCPSQNDKIIKEPLADSHCPKSKHSTKSKRKTRPKSKKVRSEIQNGLLCSDSGIGSGSGSGCFESETRIKPVRTHKSRTFESNDNERGCTNSEREGDCYRNTTENGNSYAEMCNAGSVSENSYNKLTELDSDSDQENEDVFLSLSQRLQLKLGQTSKLRSMSNGFETCLALKQSQKKCNSESEVLAQRVKPVVKQAKKKDPDLSHNTSDTGLCKAELQQKDSQLSNGKQKESFSKTRNEKLCFQYEDSALTRPDRATMINPSSVEQHDSFYNESSLYPCRPLDVSVKHDFSHAAHMMTIINTPEVVRQMRVTESDMTQCGTDQQMVQAKDQKSPLSHVLNPPPDVCKEYIDRSVSQESPKEISSLADNSLDMTHSDTTSPLSSISKTYLGNDLCENPELFLQSNMTNTSSSPQMRFARSTLCPQTPASDEKADAVSARGKVLLYQTPSPLISTNLQRSKYSSDSKSLFAKNASFVYQTPSPLSLTTLDSTVQFGHFTMQASLLNESHANLSTDGVSPCVPVQATVPASRCPDISSSTSVDNGTTVPSVKTNLSATADSPVVFNSSTSVDNSTADSPIVFNVQKFELLSVHCSKTDAPGPMESGHSNSSNIDSLDSSFSSLSLVSKTAASKSNSENLSVNKISFSDFKYKYEDSNGQEFVSLQKPSDFKDFCEITEIKNEIVPKDEKPDHDFKVKFNKDSVSETVKSDSSSAPDCPCANVSVNTSQTSEVKPNDQVKRKSKLSLKKSSSSITLGKSIPPSPLTDCRVENLQNCPVKSSESFVGVHITSFNAVMRTPTENSEEITLDSCQYNIPVTDLCHSDGGATCTTENTSKSLCEEYLNLEVDGGVNFSKTKNSHSNGAFISPCTNKVTVSQCHCKSQTECQVLNKSTEKKDPLELYCYRDNDKVFDQKQNQHFGNMKNGDLTPSYPLKSDHHLERWPNSVSVLDHSVFLTEPESEDDHGSLTAESSVHGRCMAVTMCGEDGKTNGMDNVCDQTTVESPISLSDRLKNRLSSNARVALQSLSSQRQFGMSLNVKPLK